MMRKNNLLFFLIFLILFIGCSKEEEQVLKPIISGIETAYSILEGEQLQLKPTVENENQADYVWMLDRREVGKTSSYTFNAAIPGNYELILNVSNKGGSIRHTISITVIAKGEPPVITKIEDEYNIEINTDLKLTPDVISDTDVTYSWLLNDEQISGTRECVFNVAQPGKYSLILKATNSGGTTEKTIIVTVSPKPITVETQTYSILTLDTPAYAENESEVHWEITQSASDLSRLSFADTKTPMFVSAVEGEYLLQLTAGEIQGNVKIIVKKRTKQPSAYIAKVFDYLPAPGQFVNKLPEYTEGDSHEDMVKKANDWLVGEDAWMITLGGWGGYVTFGFDHTIVNVVGKRDFRIRGNAFGAAMGRPNAPFGGSCEPGIVMVAYDKNKNGKPDEDEWYEIAGSSNFSAENEAWYSIAQENGNDVRVFRDYEMTYSKPAKETPEMSGEPDNPMAFVTIQDYIYWKDNKNNSGYKVKNVYHSQTYYPAWIKENKLTFSGIRLPENGINEGKFVPGINDGNIYFVLYGFKYGYVDNYPNVEDGSAIDIDWAIDRNGNKVHLPGIDFVKVYNGVNQENGWLGEASTEVERGEDLHLLGKSIQTIQ